MEKRRVFTVASPWYGFMCEVASWKSSEPHPATPSARDGVWQSAMEAQHVARTCTDRRRLSEVASRSPHVGALLACWLCLVLHWNDTVASLMVYSPCQEGGGAQVVGANVDERMHMQRDAYPKFCLHDAAQC